MRGLDFYSTGVKSPDFMCVFVSQYELAAKNQIQMAKGGGSLVYVVLCVLAVLTEAWWIIVIILTVGGIVGLVMILGESSKSSNSSSNGSSLVSNYFMEQLEQDKVSAPLIEEQPAIEKSRNMSPYEIAEKDNQKWLKIHNELIIKADAARREGNRAAEQSVCQSAIQRLKNAGLIERYYVKYEDYWNKRTAFIQSFQSVYSRPMYGRTDRQYELYQEDIDRVDRFIFDAKKKLPEAYYKTVLSYLQTYVGAYRYNGGEQKIYGYVRGIADDIINTKSKNYDKDVHRVIKAILEAMENEPDNDTLIRKMKDDPESFGAYERVEPVFLDNYTEYFKEAEMASRQKDYDMEFKVCQEALESLSKLNGINEVKKKVCVNYWESRKRKIVSRIIKIDNGLKPEQDNGIAANYDTVKKSKEEGEAIISRLNQFVLDAFRAIKVPYAQHLISQIGVYCSQYKKNNNWDKSIYDYLESLADKRLVLHHSDADKKFADNFKSMVEILRDKSNAEVIDWLKENFSEEKNPDSHEVVPWEHRYVYGVEDLQYADAKQKKFYEYFKKEFLAGNCLDLEGNTNYAFILMFDLGEMFQSKEGRPKLVKHLSLLASSYPKISRYSDKVIEEFDERILKKEAEEMMSKVGKEGKSTTRWIPLGESVTVAGVKTSRGGFYLGDSLTASGDNCASRYWSYPNKTSEKFLGPVVNPDFEAKFVFDSPMTSFSSYATLSKGQKYNFLSFLSGNSGYNTVHKSLLSLYLMGYEFRLFIDKHTKKDEKESLVKELVKMYNSFETVGSSDYVVENGIRQKIVNLIDRAVSAIRPSNLEKLIGEDFRIVKLPMYSKIILKEFRGGVKKLSRERAFEFADKYYHVTRGLPKGDKNYNAVRNRFFGFFSENQSTYEYHIHSPYYSDETERTEYIAQGWYYDEFFHPDAEDVCYRIKYPFSNADDNVAYEIQGAANRIYWDNAKHRELVEANRGKHTAYADMNYASYIDATEEPTLVKLSEQIDSFADSAGFTNIPVKQLVNWIAYPPRKENGIYKPYAEVIINSLFKMGYGIAPNPYVDGDRLMHEGYCCLYKLADEKGFVKNVYKGQVIVKMAIQIALSDKVTDNDINLLSEGLKSFGFEGNTFLYLVAFAKQFSFGKHNFYNAKVLEDLTKNEIPAIYNLLLRMTFNSGDVSSARVKILKRYCKALGQDPEKIHSGIHAAMTDDEFAIVEKTTGAVRYSIPKPGDVKRKFAIDTDKLERIQQQTNEAQKLLSGIFVDDKPEEKPSGEKQPDVVKSILQKLFEKPVWEFSEVDELCKESGQMTGFVLEKINDYSYEKVDDAVVEQDGDQIYVTVDYKEQLI